MIIGCVLFLSISHFRVRSALLVRIFGHPESLAIFQCSPTSHVHRTNACLRILLSWVTHWDRALWLLHFRRPAALYHVHIINNWFSCSEKHNRHSSGHMAERGHHLASQDEHFFLLDSVLAVTPTWNIF